MIGLVYIIVGLAIVVSGFLALAAFRIQTNFFVRAVNHVSTSEKLVALTFDDGPHPDFTPVILNILDQTGCKATFFVTGQAAKCWPEIVRQAHGKGHEIGNHSYSHQPWFPFYTPGHIADEIRRTSEQIAAITGVEPGFFRPPFGVTNPRIAKALRNFPLGAAGWSIRTLDGRTKATSHSILNKVKKNLRPGGIILMHDNRKLSCEVLPEVIEYIHSMGYKCVTLSGLLSSKTI